MIKRVESTESRLKRRSYEKRACRFENYPDCLMPESQYKGISVDEYVQFIRDVGLEVQVVAAEVDHGTPRFLSALLPPHAEVDKDRLPYFIEKAHENDILVLTYFPLNYCKPLATRQPGWLMEFLNDGREKPENLGWFCFNSPYRDWLPLYLLEFLDNLDIDGFYFDDTNWGSHGDAPFWPSCCCKFCEALFREDTGFDIPQKVDFESITFRKFLVWRYEKLRDFFLHITRRVRKEYKHAIVDFNYYSAVYGNWAQGHPLNPLHLEKAGGNFFVECTLYDDSGLAAKLARAQGTHGAVWLGPTQQLRECLPHSAPYAAPYTPMIRSLAAIQNGACPILALVDGPPILRQEMVKETFAEIKKRVNLMGDETVKYAALHWSQQSRDFHRPANDQFSSAAQYYRQIQGAYAIFKQSHLLVDIVLDEQLTHENLSAYRVLFLSDSACLSDAQCEVVRQFVRNGGTLVATCETSLLDEWGRPRSDFALSDVLGIASAERASVDTPPGVVYVPQEPNLLSPHTSIVCFAGRETSVKLIAIENTNVLFTRGRSSGGAPLSNFISAETIDSGRPAVTCHFFGRGKAFYISGDVGGAFAHNPYPPLKHFVASLVRQAAPPFEIIASKAVEMAATTHGGNQLRVHLLNNPIPFFAHSASGDNASDIMTYFYNVEEVNPVHNISICLRDFKPTRARLLLDHQELPISSDSILVPKVHIQEIVEIEGSWV